MRVHIGKHNVKLGKVHSISLPPGRACNTTCPCKEGKICYAHKAMYRSVVQKAWGENYQYYLRYPSQFFEDIAVLLKYQGVQHFRWHVGGDIVDQAYLDGMNHVAWGLMDMEFMCFTKMHHLDFKGVPPNLHILFSMWPGWGRTRKKHLFHGGPRIRRTWVNDPANLDPRIPDDAVECSGKCDECFKCWSELDKDVVFHIH